MRKLVTGTTLTVTIAVGLSAQTIDKPSLSLEGARRVIAAAKAEAAAKAAPGGVIAVVDDGGNLMALERLDGTFAAGANISIGKARTAALFRKPTRFFEEIINKGRTAMTALNDFTPLQGGVPITIDGRIVGGVGVSGAVSAQQDEELAMAGAAALAVMKSTASESAPATYLPRAQVDAAFAKGSPLLENGEYKIHASRREHDGQAEIHTFDTDLVYVLQGTATLVTGGNAVEARSTGAGELRGSSIEGGESRRLSEGDVVVIPNGTPHLFKDVKNPFLYYVVKVTTRRDS
jgi:glc operon protein GlcG